MQKIMRTYASMVWSVKEAIVGEGPTMKRMMPRARGSGSRILKRTSHIRIVLTDEIEVKKRENTKGQKKPGGKNRRRPNQRRSASKQVTKETKVTEASKPPAKKKSGQMEE